MPFLVEFHIHMNKLVLWCGWAGTAYFGEGGPEVSKWEGWWSTWSRANRFSDVGLWGGKVRYVSLLGKVGKRSCLLVNGASWGRVGRCCLFGILGGELGDTS